jgi:predicted nuclease of predicted toxin-antitoxin system
LRLQEFPILADENIHPEVASWVRGRGCDVLEVRGSDLVGSSDLTLIRLAHTTRRVILTHDADFGALAIARLEPIVGLVFVRPGHIDPEFTIHTLEVLFSRDLAVDPPFLLVAKRSADTVTIRVRHL